MNIYRISQNVNNKPGTFDSFIVMAEDADEARNTYVDKDYWCEPEDVKVEFIGVVDAGWLLLRDPVDTRFLSYGANVLLGSFNAG